RLLINIMKWYSSLIIFCWQSEKAFKEWNKNFVLKLFLIQKILELMQTSIQKAGEDKHTSSKKYLLPFILIISLFFLWGMAHNLNGVLIPHLKKACQLNNSQSALIDTSIFLAYFIMALPAGYLLQKIGYKLSIIIGLFAF